MTMKGLSLFSGIGGLDLAAMSVASSLWHFARSRSSPCRS